MFRMPSLAPMRVHVQRTKFCSKMKLKGEGPNLELSFWKYSWLVLVALGGANGQYLQSPCPNVFTYQLDPATREIFGYVEIPDLRVGDVAKLNVELSIAAELTNKVYGSIALIKSREQTGKDILKGLPAQYRIKFPRRDIIPAVKLIKLNEKIICSGYRAQGRLVTTIRLSHTLQIKFKTQSIVTQRVINGDRQVPQIAALPNQIDLLTKVQQTPVSSLPVNNRVCGKAVRDFSVSLSINGKRCEPGQFPWIAAMYYKSPYRGEKPIYICGATIINPRHLVTAGHCVYLADELIRPERLLTAVGIHNIDNFFEETAVFSNVQQIFPHPAYIDEDSLNEADIAVLRLVKTLVYTPYILPICLWKGDDSLDKVVNMDGLVAGWGVTEKGTTVVPYYFKARIVSKRQCSENLQRTYSHNTKIFCADGLGSGPCNGDSGSGFVMRRGDQYYLRGLVSRGRVEYDTLKCDIKKYGIYTDIAPFRFWLRDVIEVPNFG